MPDAGDRLDDYESPTDAARRVAQMQAEFARGSYESRKDESKDRRYVADQSYKGTKYSSDTSYKGTKYASDRGLEGTKYSSDRSLEGTKYSSDRNLEGTRYSSDRNLEGTRYSADRGLEGTKYRADVDERGNRLVAGNTFLTNYATLAAQPKNYFQSQNFLHNGLGAGYGTFVDEATRTVFPSGSFHPYVGTMPGNAAQGMFHQDGNDARPYEVPISDDGRYVYQAPDPVIQIEPTTGTYWQEQIEPTTGQRFYVEVDPRATYGEAGDHGGEGWRWRGLQRGPSYFGAERNDLNPEEARPMPTVGRNDLNPEEARPFFRPDVNDLNPEEARPMPATYGAGYDQGGKEDRRRFKGYVEDWRGALFQGAVGRVMPEPIFRPQPEVRYVTPSLEATRGEIDRRYQEGLIRPSFQQGGVGPYDQDGSDWTTGDAWATPEDQANLAKMDQQFRPGVHKWKAGYWAGLDDDSKDLWRSYWGYRGLSPKTVEHQIDATRVGNADYFGQGRVA